MVYARDKANLPKASIITSMEIALGLSVCLTDKTVSWSIMINNDFQNIFHTCERKTVQNAIN
ncbi:hypothetical protein BIW53_12500 [Pseudoalteromonas byunsanensis]|uniref:Uncharacterized protein n=1 Tax=Pseudoalteromonas byunsanensis TaxID=327939 RepID=A0A1S1N5Y9_9GAMM|nr:hypothetical protein BIW53_12500 [Pseudoalteromonas byunsanensis]